MPIMTDLSILREIGNQGRFFGSLPVMISMIGKPDLCCQRTRRPIYRPFGISFPILWF